MLLLQLQCTGGTGATRTLCVLMLIYIASTGKVDVVGMTEGEDKGQDDDMALGYMKPLILAAMQYAGLSHIKLGYKQPLHSSQWVYEMISGTMTSSSVRPQQQ